jgi:hypothetical protein
MWPLISSTFYRLTPLSVLCRANVFPGGGGGGRLWSAAFTRTWMRMRPFDSLGWGYDRPHWGWLSAPYVAVYNIVGPSREVAPLSLRIPDFGCVAVMYRLGAGNWMTTRNPLTRGSRLCSRDVPGVCVNLNAEAMKCMSHDVSQWAKSESTCVCWVLSRKTCVLATGSLTTTQYLNCG